MVRRISIENYKSIKHISIAAKRVNVFIGEHNSGKSNILEALSWFSVNSLSPEAFSEMFRFKTATDFFYDFDATKPIAVKTDELCLSIRYAKNKNGALLNYFEGLVYRSDEDIISINDDWNNLGKIADYVSFKLSFDGKIDSVRGSVDESSFRTYIFKRLKSFGSNFRPFLNPPFGENIPSLLISNKSYQERVRSIFKEKGFRLMMKPTENDFSIAKDVNDELYAYPYPSISETLQRIVFYTLAIESNENAVLILDEPESNTFPMYTKQLAELMALDNRNQYFIATHNPYLLESLIGKTPLDQLSVFVTRMVDYKTTAEIVNSAQLSELLNKGVELFFNLDKLSS